MSLVALPEPDRAIVARRDAIVEDLRRLVGARGHDRRRGRPPRLRDRRADRLSPPAAGGRAARLDRGGLARCCATATSTASRWWRAAPAPRCRAARCRPRTRVVIGVSRMNRVLEIDYVNRVARVEVGITNLGISEAVKARRLLLRARSVEPARLHAGRQHRHELGRRALPQVRRHHQQRARPQDGADGRRDRRDRRQPSRCAGLRPARPRRSARRASSASSPRRPCASCARPRARGPCCSASTPARPPASASPPSSAPASSRSPSSSWTGRRSRSARRSPRPATRWRSRRC